MRTPTDKQFRKRALSIRYAVLDLQRRIGEIKSYGAGVIGTTNQHHLQTAYDALNIAQSSLLETKFDRDA